MNDVAESFQRFLHGDLYEDNNHDVSHEANRLQKRPLEKNVADNTVDQDCESQFMLLETWGGNIRPLCYGIE